jgi:hypothetical protein
MESSGRITHAPERREIKGNRRGDNHTSGGVPEAEEHVARKTVWLLRRGRYLLESGRGFRLLCPQFPQGQYDVARLQYLTDYSRYRIP